MSVDLSIYKKLNLFDLEISFKKNRGVLGILGGSGCGKSSILKCIAGIFDIDEGYIRIGEKEVVNTKTKVYIKTKSRKLGYLFQNYALFPNMSVEKNILSASRLSKERLVEILDLFDLVDLARFYPSTLSGGQQQRVALARMLASEPRLLLFDEPFSAIDSILKERLSYGFKKLLDEFEGVSIIVTHNRDEAYQLCDEIIVMDEGKVVAKGRTIDVFERPTNEVAARLTGCKNILKAKKVGENRVYIEELAKEFICESRVPDEIKSVGIRAHDLVCNDEEILNSIYVEHLNVINLPFEFQYFVNSKLWYKQTKSSLTLEPPKVTGYLSLPPSKLLPLI